MHEYILELNHITKRFPGVLALDDVSLKIRPGTVHALCGENGAGKSTLMKCLFGIYKMDEGEVIVNGEKKEFKNTRQALDNGISMIHQELHPIRDRSVMENLWVGRIPNKGILVSQKEMYQKTVDLLEKLRVHVNPYEKAGNLSAAMIQLIEIAKAVSFHSKIIVMDEPTSSLTEPEVESLFQIIDELVAAGTSIIYISHKMEEILKISHDVSVMRDGKMVGTWPASELTTEAIIQKMVDRDMSHRFPPCRHTPSEEVVLKVSSLTSDDPKSFRDISFELHKGEILGIGGLVGAQRTELVEAIFGLRGIEKGTIEMHGRELQIKSPADAIAAKMALLTEERRQTGIFPELPILENTVIVNERMYASKAGIIKQNERMQAADEGCSKLKVKTPSLQQKIQNLSGGNQQKVLVARWLLTNPDVLILDEPTRGIDVGAKYEIYTLIHQMAEEGRAVIMITSEMPELLGISDRVFVMCEGKLSGFLEKDAFSQVNVMRLATQYMEDESEKVQK